MYKTRVQNRYRARNVLEPEQIEAGDGDLDPLKEAEHEANLPLRALGRVAV